MSPPALRRYRAERLLRKQFPALRSKVLAVVRSQLRGKGVSLDPADLEVCYAQAWQGLYTKVLGGEQVENPLAWLVLVTFRRAIDEARSAGRAHARGHAYPVSSDLDDAIESGHVRSEPDLAGALDDRARLRHVFEGMRARLSERECEAASLCYVQGLSRAEAARQMGISEARMRKLMEGTGPGRLGVAGKVGELLDTISGGGWCQQQSSLMRAYAFGVLNPAGERHALAVAHCRECPACRAYVASLRGLAAVLPPLPLLSQLLLGGGTGAAGTTSAGANTAVGGASGPAVGAGSLAAKLAVTVLVVLGGGYAVLGSRAHGSPTERHATVVPSLHAVAPVSHAVAPTAHVAGVLAQPLSPVLGVPARRAHSRARRARTGRAAAGHSSSGGRPTGEPAAREFGPERVQREARATANRSSAPVRSRAAPVVGGEFGFE